MKKMTLFVPEGGATRPRNVTIRGNKATLTVVVGKSQWDPDPRTSVGVAAIGLWCHLVRKAADAGLIPSVRLRRFREAAARPFEVCRLPPSDIRLVRDCWMSLYLAPGLDLTPEQCDRIAEAAMCAVDTRACPELLCRCRRELDQSPRCRLDMSWTVDVPTLLDLAEKVAGNCFRYKELRT